MGKKDPRVDALIDKAAPFAQPVLRKLRVWVHRHCPDAEEAIKWGHASFLYKGKLLCAMAAFKEHCSFGYWHPALREKQAGKDAWGQYGRMTSVRDLPPEAEFARQIKEALALENEGVSRSVPRKEPRKALPVPEDLAAALKRNTKAGRFFQDLAPSCQRDYIEWIIEAKRPETREKRLATTLEWLAEGKKRNWKYANC